MRDSTSRRRGEARLPQAVADDDRRGGAGVAVAEGAAACRRDAEDREEVRRDARDLDALGEAVGAAGGGERLASEIPGRDLVDGAKPLAIVDDLGARQPGAVGDGVELSVLEADQALGAGVRLLEHDAVEDAEEGDRRAHAEHERDPGHRGVAGGPDQLPDGVAEFAHAAP